MYPRRVDPARSRISGSLRSQRGRARRGERLVEIAEDVVDVLDADGEADVTVGHARREPILRRELRMRGRCGMDREAARVADIGDVIQQLQRVDEAPARLAAAREFKTDEPAVTALEIFARALAADAGLYRGVDHLDH